MFDIGRNVSLKHAWRSRVAGCGGESGSIEIMVAKESIAMVEACCYPRLLCVVRLPCIQSILLLIDGDGQFQVRLVFQRSDIADIDCPYAFSQPT